MANVFKSLTFVVAVLASFGLAWPAAAVTVTFEFGGDGGDLGPDETFTQDGFSLFVESDGGNVHQGVDGLGVTGGFNGNLLARNASSVDPMFETLSFTFTPEVVLLSGIFFEHQGATERFEILNQDGALIRGVAINGGGSNSTFVPVLGLDLRAETFTVRHIAGSGIRVSSLSVSTVPVPATGLLLLSALVGAGVMFRRQKAA